MGNKGSESFRKVNEELLIEANTKYGADMGYIMLNEEVPPFPSHRTGKTNYYSSSDQCSRQMRTSRLN